MQRAPVVGVEEARVEVEVAVEELLLSPDHPKPTFGVEGQLRPVDVARDTGQGVVGAPHLVVLEVTHQVDLIAAARVALPHRPHLAPVRRVRRDVWKVVRAHVGGEPHGLLEPRVGLEVGSWNHRFVEEGPRLALVHLKQQLPRGLVLGRGVGPDSTRLGIVRRRSRVAVFLEDLHRVVIGRMLRWRRQRRPRPGGHPIEQLLGRLREAQRRHSDQDRYR